MLVSGAGKKRFASGPSITAALSLYADSTPRGLASLLRRIIWKSDWGCLSPSRIRSALNILWRQCSLLAWANIINSTSVGLRPKARKLSAR